MTIPLLRDCANAAYQVTLAEFLAYDDGTDQRYELVDGILVAMGAESTDNTAIAIVLMFQFATLGILPYRLANKHLIEVSSDAASSRYPDLVVHSEASYAAIAHRPQACLLLVDPSPLLVVEVVSPGDEDSENYQRDYVQKPREYAARRIPEYWIIDPQRAVIGIGTLVGNVYAFRWVTGNQAIASPTFPMLNLTAEAVLQAEQ